MAHNQSSSPLCSVPLSSRTNGSLSPRAALASSAPAETVAALSSPPRISRQPTTSPSVPKPPPDFLPSHRSGPASAQIRFTHARSIRPPSACALVPLQPTRRNARTEKDREPSPTVTRRLRFPPSRTQTHRELPKQPPIRSHPRTRLASPPTTITRPGSFVRHFAETKQLPIPPTLVMAV